ncbi:MAG: carbamoyl-phosphate synthase large subunit [Clostridiales bacterium]|jgi:carbamoyl-phosphate synthase large subunit|nr:carbamoyl-phosphate synthase large subunit [Clostridiales bacterium]
MPLNTEIRKVLLIGSGAIVIGQAAEFDYSGTQALRALKEDGIEVVLVNSNPATIMTDNAMADRIYIEPLTLETVKRIIEKEKPDSILSGFGGQTGLTLCMRLAREGFLRKHKIRLLGAGPETIDKAEDRQLFKDLMESINQPCIPSEVVTTAGDALRVAAELGYPVIVRPAFTLGGSGGGIASDEVKMREISANGLEMSPISQILVEKCVSGWKEIEYEIIRDNNGNTISVCAMENFDPVGIHTGDSIVVAPTMTLADKEYQMLRKAAFDIVNALDMKGGCNVQFALDPDSFGYAVIEVNPRVSRSSALASKATGYPIAKVATKIAVGYNLDEITNAVTGKTFASFEPALDYAVVKFPKWPFDKFVYAKRELGTQMKATGEVMSIGDCFEAALLKAVRGAELPVDFLEYKKFREADDKFLFYHIEKATDERIFAVYEALYRGLGADEIFEKSKIDRWFLYKIKNIADFAKSIENKKISYEEYARGKKYGFTDKTLKKISGNDIPYSLKPDYKMVDTCACEFFADTPYFYSAFNTPESGGENEAAEYIQRGKKETIVVLGSGCIRIGQGIEFDYASVHCVRTLKKLGYNVVIVNNNPETVSTDFDTSDRLYFEPLTAEDVLHIIDAEKPVGAVVAFGGQTAIKLTDALSKHGVKIIGTGADSIDMAEDRKRFDELLEKIDVKRPLGRTVLTREEALNAANGLGYPVLIRPSYVLGGQNMIVAFSDADVEEFMRIILEYNITNPILVDKYISGNETEIDAIFDGEDIFIPGIMEHVERAGIHSGDSIAVYPPQNITDDMYEKIVETSYKLCRGLNVRGIVNIQYIIKNGDLYVIEVNPRASRTVPYLSKVTMVPICEIATKVSLGAKLKDLPYGTGIWRDMPYTAVKVPVFSFEKLTDVDTMLGAEMKSTGEVLGIGKNLQEALYKGLLAAGYRLKKSGGVFISVRNQDKGEIAAIAKKFADQKFKIYATEGTAEILKKAAINVAVVKKIHEDPTDNTRTLIKSGKIDYIISTSAKGRDPARDSVKIRRLATMNKIPCLTSIDTANALAECLLGRFSESNTELVDINNMRKDKMKLKFTKMHGAGNDYIYINCFENAINSPESLSAYLADRHFGIGGDGIVLICPSDVADAKMRMFNLDGSEGKMCGNAIRCVAKYLYDKDIVKKTEMRIETLSGIKKLKLFTKSGKVSRVSVDMGRAITAAKEIPVAFGKDSVINERVTIGGADYDITCVSMGNPHCIVFCDDIDVLDLQKLGPLFENHELFPERVNTEFVKIINSNGIAMRVWERGSGETLACGTGACAAAAAAVLNGFCEKNADITVKLLGGELTVNYGDGGVVMTGDAKLVYEGVVEI